MAKKAHTAAALTKQRHTAESVWELINFSYRERRKLSS